MALTSTSPEWLKMTQAEKDAAQRAAMGISDAKPVTYQGAGAEETAARIAAQQPKPQQGVDTSSYEAWKASGGQAAGGYDAVIAAQKTTPQAVGADRTAVAGISTGVGSDGQITPPKTQLQIFQEENARLQLENQALSDRRAAEQKAAEAARGMRNIPVGQTGIDATLPYDTGTPGGGVSPLSGLTPEQQAIYGQKLGTAEQIAKLSLGGVAGEAQSLEAIRRLQVSQALQQSNIGGRPAQDAISAKETELGRRLTSQELLGMAAQEGIDLSQSNIDRITSKGNAEIDNIKIQRDYELAQAQYSQNQLERTGNRAISDREQFNVQQDAKRRRMAAIFGAADVSTANAAIIDQNSKDQQALDDLRMEFIDKTDLASKLGVAITKTAGNNISQIQNDMSNKIEEKYLGLQKSINDLLAQGITDSNEIRNATLSVQKEYLTSYDKIMTEGLAALKENSSAIDKDIQTIKKMRDSGIIDQDEYKSAIKTKIGIEKPMNEIERLSKMSEIRYRDSQTAEIQLKNRAMASDLQDLGGTNPQLLDKLASFVPGVVPNTPGISEQNKGECGAVVNYALGTPGKFGDSYESKAKWMNNRDVNSPTIGSVFVSNIGVKDPTKDPGHVGFVKDYDPNTGLVTLGDSNRYGNNKQWDERQVAVSELASREGIVGFYNPAQDAKYNTGKNDIEILVDSTVNGIMPIDRLLQSVDKENRVRAMSMFNQKLTQAADKEPDAIAKKMILSRAKKVPSGAELEQMQKAMSSVEQLMEITSAAETLISAGKVGPISGRAAKLNLFDTDVDRLDRLLTGLVPGVARGTFGEVGVLTDHDIANYKQVVGDITKTPEQIRSANRDLQKLILQNMLSGFSTSPFNVSDSISKYKEVINRINPEIRKELGMPVENIIKADKYRTVPVPTELSQYPFLTN